MAELNVSDLDFDTIKANLKTYLRSQSEFSDYNFDGAALSVLLDILAYNTHYNATLAHLAGNEMFIDSAVKRSSVVSIAKTMGYTPRSTISARAVVDIVVTPASSYTSSSLTLNRNIPFTAASNGKVYTFYPSTTYTAQLIDGQFTFYSVELIEGTRITNTFIIDQSNTSGPLVIPNSKIDKSTISVVVQQSTSNPVQETFAYYNSILDVSSTSKVFYVDENPYGLYEVRFGDGIISHELSVGNVVAIEYFVSSGPAANYISNFTVGGTLTGSGEIKTAYAVTAAAGGAEAETLESIRVNAPLFNATKNRAVTSNDYAALIKAQFNNVNSVVVWGGEENDPPVYGKVFVSIDPLPNTVITMSDKDNITSNIIKPRSVVSIQTEFVDPIYHYMTVVANVKFDRTITKATSADIGVLVDNAVRTYFSENLNALEKNFYYSDLVKYIQAVDSSIFSISLDTKLHRRVDVYTGYTNVFDVSFNTAVEPGLFKSSHFNTTIGDSVVGVYLTDDITGDTALSETGDIVVRRVDNGKIVMRKAGTITSGTGRIVIPGINVTSTVNDFRFYVTPEGTSPDVLTVDLTRTSDVSNSAVFPLASRNTVLRLDDSSGDTLNGIPVGLTVNAISSVGK